MESRSADRIMNKDDLISVIVPVYNVEKYIARCIESILTQSYTNFELLLIDDGSTDDSLEICEKYRNLDDRVRCFHKKNGGLSSARNYGLDRMKGKFVTFIDSDDFVGADYLKILFEMMNNDSPDVTIIGVEDFYKDDSPVNERQEDIRSLIKRENIFREMVLFEKFTWSACAKLFKRELFEHSRFPIGALYEDLRTIPYILCNCNAISCSSAKQYFYYINRIGSITRSINQTSISMWEEGMDQLLMYAQRNKQQDFPYLEARFSTCIFWDVIDRLLLSENYINYSSRLRNKYRPHLRKAWRLPLLTVKGKLKVYMFLINLELYRRVRIGWIKQKGYANESIFLESN